MLCSCTNCKAEFDLKEEFLGKTVECPNCKTTFVVTEKPLGDKPLVIEGISVQEKDMTEKGIFGKSKGYPSLKAWGLPVLVHSKYLFSF